MIMNFTTNNYVIANYNSGNSKHLFLSNLSAGLQYTERISFLMLLILEAGPDKKHTALCRRPSAET